MLAFAEILSRVIWGEQMMEMPLTVNRPVVERFQWSRGPNGPLTKPRDRETMYKSCVKGSGSASRKSRRWRSRTLLMNSPLGEIKGHALEPKSMLFWFKASVTPLTWEV